MTSHFQELRAAAWILIASCLLVGCNPAPDLKAPIIPPDTLASPAAVGYVFRSEQLIFVDAPGNAPSGASAVAGAVVAAYDLQGQLLAETTTDSSGAFSLEFFDAGFVRLVVRDAKQSGEATAFATVIPGVQIRVGSPASVTRQQAIETVLAGVPDTALVGAAMNPFPEGTLLYPPLREDGSVPLQEDGITLEADSWVFVVDGSPFKEQTHGYEYVLVDARTGALRRLNVNYPLFINHARLWRSTDDWFVFSPAQGRLDPADLPEGASATPSPEVVQLPENPASDSPPDSVTDFPLPLNNDLYDAIAADDLLSGAKATEAPLGKQSGFNNGEEGVFAVLIRCGDDSHFEQNLNRFVNHLVLEGVPQANIGIADFTRNEAPYVPRENLEASDASKIRQASLNGMLQPAVLFFEPVIQQRLYQGLHSTLIVYVSGHGGGGDVVVDFDKDQSGSWAFGAADMGLPATLACRVRVIIQSCHAEVFQKDLAKVFAPTEHDVKVFSASAVSESANATPGWVTYIPFVNFLRQGGSHFTTRFVRTMGIEGGDITGVTETDVNGIEVLVDALADMEEAPPAPFVRPFRPFWCFPVDEGEGGIALEGEGGIALEGEGGVALEGEGMPEGGGDGEGEGEGEGEGIAEGSAEGEAEGTGEGEQAPLDDVGFLLEVIGGPEFAEAALANAETLPTNLLRLWPAEATGGQLPADSVEITHRVIAVLDLTAEEAETLFSRSAVQPGVFSCSTEESVALTECPLQNADLPGGAWMFVATVVRAPIPLEDFTFRKQFFFLFETDNETSNNWESSAAYPSDQYQGTDTWYVIGSTSVGWGLTVNRHFGGEEIDMIRSAARVILRGNTALLAVPLSEFPEGVAGMRQVALRDASGSESRSIDYHPELDEVTIVP